MLSLLSTEGENDCCLEDVLVFFTGADQVPPLGFDKDCQVLVTWSFACLLVMAKITPLLKRCNITMVLVARNFLIISNCHVLTARFM